MLVPIPPMPKSPSMTVLRIEHSNRYKPKFFKVFSNGFHIKVNKVESLGPCIWQMDLKLVFSIVSNCAAKTFEFTAI